MQYGIVFNWDVKGSQIVKVTTEPIYQHSIGVHKITLNAETPTGNIIAVTFQDETHQPITASLDMATSDYKVWTLNIPDIVLATSGTKYISFANKKPVESGGIITYTVQTSGIVAVTIDASAVEEGVTPIEEQVATSLQNQINQLNEETADMLHSDGSVPMDDDYTPTEDQDIATKKYVDDNGATVDVGTVTTGQPGTNAQVIPRGTAHDRVLDFIIPRGDKGYTGETGTAFRFRGAYSSLVAYQCDSTYIDVVSFNNSSYVCLQDENTGNQPDVSPTYWGVLALKGNDGTSFYISATFESIAEMEADFDNYNEGQFVLIASDVDDPDNAKLFVRGESEWRFLTDLSGAIGLTGVGIASIVKTGTNGLVDTYTITMTDSPATTYTFTVTNGRGISSFVKTSSSGLVDTYTITFNDGTTTTIEVTNGNGIASIVKTGTSGLVDTYTITFDNGSTTTFQVTNGRDGEGSGDTTVYFNNVAQSKVDFDSDPQTQISKNASDIGDIQAVIPSEATSSNQLGDKNFINSSIATNTAYFCGTFENVPTLLAYSGTVTNNDYANVRNSVITDSGNDWATFGDLDNYDKTLVTNFDYAWVVNGTKFDLYRFDIVEQEWDLRVPNTDKADVTLNTAYNRYKASVVNNVITWMFEFTYNNSSYTAQQWASINSGITSGLVTQIGTNQSNISTLQTSVASKSEKGQSFTITLDSNDWLNGEQTISDVRFVTSGYIYIITPTSTSFAEYGESQIVAQEVETTGEITFTCQSEPTNDLVVNVLKVQVA